jgi:hypothetical protein
VIGVVFLVLDAVRGVELAAPLTAAVALVYLFLWYRLPSVATDREDDEEEELDEGEASPTGESVSTNPATATAARGFRE